jgi:hypothetical protein
LIKERKEKEMSVGSVTGNVRTLSNITEDLNKAILEISKTKDTFDKATTAVTNASAAHSKAVEHAQYLREEMNAALNASMGPEQTNVRQSA